MNWDKVKDRDTIVLVEGPFDCLRLPNDSVASFGQVLHRKQRWFLQKSDAKEIVILYDSEPAAQKRALDAAASLRATKRVRIGFLPEGKDPADLPVEIVWNCITKAEPYSPVLRGRI
jgi:DNA primase